MSATFAAWLAWPDRSIVTVAIFQPNYKLVGWTNVGGATPNAYSIDFDAFDFTDVFAGGLYRKVVGLKENATALTAVASLALVNSTASSYFWDEANGILYAHSSTGSDPDLFTVYHAQLEIRVATHGIVLNQTDGNGDTGIYHEPWLRADGPAPNVTTSWEDFFFGVTSSAGSQLLVNNPDGIWYRIVANDGNYWWKNTPVSFYLGGTYNGQTLPWSQYGTYQTMLVENVAPDDDKCAFELKPLRRALDQLFPVTPIFESEYPNLGDGVRGTRKWIGFGRTTMPPDLTDTSSYGVYTIADADYQTLFAIYGVNAINKTTGVRTALTETTHYTKDLTACTVTIVNATYSWQNYTIEVDVAGQPDGAGTDYLKTVGEIAKYLLTEIAGIDVARINTSAFDQADIDAPEELTLWEKSPRQLSSIFASSQQGFASLSASAFATIQQTLAGLWTILVWSPSYDASTVVRLAKSDFSLFEPKPQLQTVFGATRVFYNQNKSTDTWATESDEDPEVQYLAQTNDVRERYTYLRSATDAQTLAQRSQLLAGSQSLEIEFAERGSLLAQALAGDKVLITRDPAPAAAGMFTSKPFEIIRLEKRPNLMIAGRFSDLRGVGAVIGHWKSDTDPNWATATDDERASNHGFWTDDNGRADAADPASAGQSIYW
jgi:hypothetical protein